MAWIPPECEIRVRLVLPVQPPSPAQAIPRQRIPPDDIDDLLAQLTVTSTAGDTIEQIERAAISLAESHTQAPPRKILSQVVPLDQRVRSLLAGRLRLSQRRDLYRIESLLLSHACLLLGDLNENALAERYGLAALAFAKEAESDQAVAMTVLAKTFRWQKRFTESMDMACRGFAYSPNTPIRVQLASQEANAAALLGHAGRAREALARAERAAELVTPDSGLSAWSFPVTRQAVFAQSVATRVSSTMVNAIPFLWLKGWHAPAGRRACEPRPLAQDGQIGTAPPVGAITWNPADESLAGQPERASADSEVRPGPRPPTLRPHHRKTAQAGPGALPTSSLPTLSGRLADWVIVGGRPYLPVLCVLCPARRSTAFDFGPV
jgi:hypothetical protein